jgi:hypothetical protein
VPKPVHGVTPRESELILHEVDLSFGWDHKSLVESLRAGASRPQNLTLAVTEFAKSLRPFLVATFLIAQPKHDRTAGAIEAADVRYYEPETPALQRGAVGLKRWRLLVD